MEKIKMLVLFAVALLAVGAIYGSASLLKQKDAGTCAEAGCSSCNGNCGMTGCNCAGNSGCSAEGCTNQNCGSCNGNCGTAGCGCAK